MQSQSEYNRQKDLKVCGAHEVRLQLRGYAVHADRLLDGPREAVRQRAQPLGQQPRLRHRSRAAMLSYWDDVTASAEYGAWHAQVDAGSSVLHWSRCPGSSDSRLCSAMQCRTTDPACSGTYTELDRGQGRGIRMRPLQHRR